MSFTDEERTKRRSRYWASEIAGIVGLDPYTTPLEVAAEKLGQGVPKIFTDNMERGVFLEPAMRNWYAKRTGKWVSVPGMIESTRHPLMGASPDGLVAPEPKPNGEAVHVETVEAVLEIKVPGEYADAWGPEGSQDIPMHYVPQVAWQMAVVDVDRADVAALVKGKLRIYPIQRDREFEGMLIERVEKFHRDYVSQGKLPPATAADLDWLKGKFGRSALDYIEADEETTKLANMLRKARSARQEAEAAESSARASLELIIGAHAGLRGPFGRIDWKSNKDGSRTDWKAAMLELRNHIALDPSASELLKELDSIEAKWTKATIGARPFVPRFRDDWDEG
jgi:putative phage-type endonuclease